MEIKADDCYWWSLLSPYYGIRFIVVPIFGPLSFVTGAFLLIASPLLVSGAILWTPFRICEKYKDYLVKWDSVQKDIDRQTEIYNRGRMGRADVGCYPNPCSPYVNKTSFWDLWFQGFFL